MIKPLYDTTDTGTGCPSPQCLVYLKYNGKEQALCKLAERGTKTKKGDRNSNKIVKYTIRLNVKIIVIYIHSLCRFLAVFIGIKSDTLACKDVYMQDSTKATIKDWRYIERGTSKHASYTDQQFSWPNLWVHLCFQPVYCLWGKDIESSLKNSSFSSFASNTVLKPALLTQQESCWFFQLVVSANSSEYQSGLMRCDPREYLVQPRRELTVAIYSIKAKFSPHFLSRHFQSEVQKETAKKDRETETERERGRILIGLCWNLKQSWCCLAGWIYQSHRSLMTPRLWNEGSKALKTPIY